MKPETVEERVEHTPGPWEAVGALVSQYEIRDGKKLWGLYVANCSILDEPEAFANARLIAAAPDLLRLLMRYRTETPLGHQPHMIAQEADDVIASALTKAFVR